MRLRYNSSAIRRFLTMCTWQKTLKLYSVSPLWRQWSDIGNIGCYLNIHITHKINLYIKILYCNVSIDSPKCLQSTMRMLRWFLPDVSTKTLKLACFNNLLLIISLLPEACFGLRVLSLAKWIIMLRFVDLRCPRVLRRSNVGLVQFVIWLIYHIK